MTQTAHARLRAAHEVRVGRDGQTRPADIAYAAYIAVLLAAILGVPIVRAIVLGLMTPSARSVLFAPPAAAVVAAIAGALLVAALLAGRTRGPVVSDPFRAWLLTAVDIPGRATLRGSFARSASGVGLVIVAITTITGLGLWFGGGVTGASIVGFVAGSALFSVLLTTAWLAGQALDDRRLWAISAGIAVLIGASIAVPATLAFTPWGWTSALWPPAVGAATAPLAAGPLIALAVIAVACTLVVPRLLDRILPSTALWQATRWHAALTLARTGDAAATLGALGRARARGRGIHLALSRFLPAAWLARDALVALRRPVRSVVGFVALVGSGALLGSAAASPAAGTAPALSGAILLFLAAGVFCDGLRSAADGAGRAPLLGVSVRADAAMHTVFPLLLAIAASELGALLAGAGAMSGWVVAVAACIVIVRAMDAAKGPLPIELLMPVPTPMGDVSVVTVLLWQSDALLLSLLVAGGLTIALPAWGAGAWIALAVAAAVLLAMANHRFVKAAAAQGADGP